ncbi:hypothetical protein LCGC14_2845910, partial [marine sediment metagenome]
MNYKLRILLFGEMKTQDITPSYKKAFESLGCEVTTFDPTEHYSISLWNRVLNRFLTELIRIKKGLGVRVYFGVQELNKVLLEKVRETRPQLVFFSKPVTIKPATITAIQKLGAKTFAWHNDDLLNPRAVSRILFKAFPLYDCQFTPRSFAIQEFLKLGAKKAETLPFSANTDLYYPEEVIEDEDRKKGADIVFIGTYYEKSRAEILEKLCRHGYDLKVYGNEWHKYNEGKCLKEKAIMYRPIYGEEYRRVMNSSKIALAFLGKVMRDQHTHRSLEIPACGTFMLHERTQEISALYKEGEEAEFFGSFDELVEKVDYYLKNESERKKIALA